MKKRMKAVFWTDKPSWCSRTPMGWTYVLANEAGLVKFGKSQVSLKERAKQIYGYPGFYFVMAFAGTDLESKLHIHFDKIRCCYIPILQNIEIDLCDYITYEELHSSSISNSGVRYRKTRKELFKLKYSGSLVEYMLQELKPLGFIPVQMDSPDEVLPFNSEYTQKMMAKQVSRIAAKKLRSFEQEGKE